MMTARDMMDNASMQTVYAHLDTDEEIVAAIQVHGTKDDLVTIGQAMIDGDITAFQKALSARKITAYLTKAIPATNEIYCLYLPPYYLFLDMKPTRV